MLNNLLRLCKIIFKGLKSTCSDIYVEDEPVSVNGMDPVVRFNFNVVQH